MLKYKINRVFINYQVLVGFFFFFSRVAKLRTEIIIIHSSHCIVNYSSISNYNLRRGSKESTKGLREQGQLSTILYLDKYGLEDVLYTPSAIFAYRHIHIFYWTEIVYQL